MVAQRLAMIIKKEDLVTSRAQITLQVSVAMNTEKEAEKETSTVVDEISLLTQHVREAITAIMTHTKEEQITTTIEIRETIATSVIINLLLVTMVPQVATSTAQEEAIVAVMTTTIDVEVVSKEITKPINPTKEDLSKVIIPRVHQTSTDAVTTTTIVTVLDSSKTATMIGTSQELALSIVAMASMTINEATRILSLMDLLKVAILTKVVVLSRDATPMTSIITRTRATTEEVTLTLVITITEAAISIIVAVIITTNVAAHTTVVKA